jgi:hypothetical protein
MIVACTVVVDHVIMIHDRAIESSAATDETPMSTKKITSFVTHLSSSIPNLQLDGLLVHLHGAKAKVNPDS